MVSEETVTEYQNYIELMLNEFAEFQSLQIKLSTSIQGEIVTYHRKNEEINNVFSFSETYCTDITFNDNILQYKILTSLITKTNALKRIELLKRQIETEENIIRLAEIVFPVTEENERLLNEKMKCRLSWEGE